MNRLNRINEAYSNWTGKTADQVVSLPPSGSKRQYFRILHGDHSFIAVFNPNQTENETFIRLSHHFRKIGARVPEVLFKSKDREVYIQQDLGSTSLLDTLIKSRGDSDNFPSSVKSSYQKALKGLADIQINGAKKLDFSKSYPRPRFDKRLIRWDLNYFKYSFLNPLGIEYDQDELEEAFTEIRQLVLSQDDHYFLYRDFQARNIMIHDNKPWFIDFQGGMQGPLLYDVVSLLYQARAAIPEKNRQQLFEFYLEEAQKRTKLNTNKAKRIFPVFALLRIFQTLGAYGLRGLVEGKGHFLRSIQPAISTSLKPLIESDTLPLKSKAIHRLCKKLIDPQTLTPLHYLDKESISGKLTIRIQSFSYKRGIPKDPSGNGGGFVFDCRSIHNPGRYEPYKKLTGRDLPVQDFLVEKSEIPQFLKTAFKMVDETVKKYKSRNFEHLVVSFGCTGGQHRSVYSADRLAEHLRQDPELDVIVTHIEQEIKQWKN